MKFGWKKYVDEYVKAPNGEVVYTGRYYRLFADAPAVKKLKTAGWLLAAIALALFLTAGFNEYASSRTLYVVLPYVISVFPAVFMLVAAIRLSRAPERMTRKQYDESVVLHRRCAVVLLIAAAVAFFGDIVFLVTARPAQRLLNEIVFAVCCALMAAAGGLSLYIASKTPSGPEED